MRLFEQKVKLYIDSMNLIALGDHLLVACSGGVDSMALLHFLHKNRKQWGYKLSCVHVDHMLRGAVSKEDMEHVKKYCQQHEIDFYGKSINIPQILVTEGGNSQAICRRERYTYFREIMQQIAATSIVTAHHADDQMESMLMSLTKNSSVIGLSGIHAKRDFYNGKIIRPFLPVTKSEIRGYLQKNNLTWREDCSNEKDDYMRNRIRHQVVPHLKKENSNVAANFVQVGNQIREDNEYLMDVAKQRFSSIVSKSDENSYFLKIDALKREPVALQRRLILILLNYIYGDAHTYQTYTLTTSILSLCQSENGSSKIHLPENILVKKEYNLLTVGEPQSSTELKEISLVMDKWQYFDVYRMMVGIAKHMPQSPTDHSISYYFNSKVVNLPLLVRSIKDGDRILVKGMQQPKRVSRIFIDDKVPVQKRQTWPIIADQEQTIFAVVGLRYCDKFSVNKRPDDDYFILIEDASL